MEFKAVPLIIRKEKESLKDKIKRMKDAEASAGMQTTSSV